MSLISLAFPTQTSTKQDTHYVPPTRKRDFDSFKNTQGTLSNQGSQIFKCADFITPTTATSKTLYRSTYASGAARANESFQLVDHGSASSKNKGLMKSHAGMNRTNRQALFQNRNNRRLNQCLLFIYFLIFMINLLNVYVYFCS